MSLSVFTNWAVGLINGYKQKENGLPNGIKYGTIGVTTFVAMIKTLAHMDKSSSMSMINTGATPVQKMAGLGATPVQKMAGLFIGVPIFMLSNFCVGNHFGEAIRWAEDDSRSGKNGVRLKLL